MKTLREELLEILGNIGEKLDTYAMEIRIAEAVGSTARRDSIEMRANLLKVYRVKLQSALDRAKGEGGGQ